MVLVKIADRQSNDTLPQALSAGEAPEDAPGLHSYSYLCGAGPASKARLAEIPEDRLRAMLKVVLGFVAVDEPWYLETNPDVAQAVKTGNAASARAHYANAGYYENRWPYRINVDESWYLAEYPDVKTAIARGNVESCQDHFNRYGFLEGRLPSKGWSLLARRPSYLGSQQGK
jgi:hypothetical protein